jgi:hypothetical protein
LPISFGTPKNPCTEYITFDVVDMLYCYNTIFGRGLLNTFEAALHLGYLYLKVPASALHLGYLYLKVPASFDIITVFGSQKEARNIERGFALGHKNVHFLREDTEQHEQE